MPGDNGGDVNKTTKEVGYLSGWTSAWGLRGGMMMTSLANNELNGRSVVAAKKQSQIEDK
jgi:hypothetical protein